MDEGNMDMPVMEKRKKAVGAEAIPLLIVSIL